MGSHQEAQPLAPKMASLSLKVPPRKPKSNALPSPFSGQMQFNAPSTSTKNTQQLKLDTTPEALNEQFTDYNAHPGGLAHGTQSAPASATVPTSSTSPNAMNSASPRGRTPSSTQAADMQARILALQRSRSRQGSVPSTQSSSILARRKSSGSSDEEQKQTSPLESPISPTFDPNTVISPTALSMATNSLPLSLSRNSSFRTKQRSSLSERRGMKLNTLPDRTAGSASPKVSFDLDTKPPTSRVPGEKGNRGLFRDYRKYIDIESGSLNFAGKACVHAQGIEFSSGEKFNISMDKLEFISEIGSGNYGTVQKLLHKPNNVLMAVKEIKLELDEASLRQIIMELDVLHRCNVESIIAFYGAFFVEGSVYICMEYMDGGSINKIYNGGIEEKYLKYIVRDVVSGLKELKEDFNIIHRDVKPTNILCSTDGHVKLCDFGVSGNLVASIARTNIGCQAYMAPERIKGDRMTQDPQGVTYTVESDIWSLGLSIIEMAKGSYPYPSESFQSIFSQLNAIVEDPAPALDPTKYSPEACDFVNKLLSKSPIERPRYGDIVKHPWLANVECTREEFGNFVKERIASQSDNEV